MSIQRENDAVECVQPLLYDSHAHAQPANAASIDLVEFEIERPVDVTLTFKDVAYYVNDGKSAVKNILRGVSGYVRSGQLLAVLGPSGAGKSTLLDIIAQRPKSGTVSGSIMLNGREIQQSVFRRISGYVQQEDLLQSYLTVRESIFYAAELRTPPTLTREVLMSRTQHIMRMLGIEGVQDMKIGSEVMRGISGGEKKRCAIAMELVATPSLLFLDELTTGLDTFTALHLLTILKDLAEAGVAVVFSIHQPRSSIFHLFDQVLLLNGGGEQAYFGPAGEAMPFLARIGIEPYLPENPADFLLDTVAVLSTEAVRGDDWMQRHKITPVQNGATVAESFRRLLSHTVKHEIDTLNDAYGKSAAGIPLSVSSPYYRSVLTQIRVVSTRAVLNKLRDPIATLAAVVAAIFFAVLIGSVYFRVGLAAPSIRNRMGVLFFVVMNTAFSSLGSLGVLMVDRAIFVREHSNGMYRAIAYYIGKIVQDVPISVLTNLIFNSIVYFMVGLQPRADKFFLFYLACTLTMLNSYALCLFISSLSKNMQVANIVAPLLFVLYLLPSGGVLMSSSSMPIIWRWIEYISFVRYGFAALVINEFHGLRFDCPPDAPMCVEDGLRYAESQGFFADDLWKYIGASAGSMGIYLLAGYVALVALRTRETK